MLGRLLPMTHHLYQLLRSCPQTCTQNVQPYIFLEPKLLLLSGIPIPWALTHGTAPPLAPAVIATVLDLDQIASTVRMKLAGHVLLARHVLPLVRDSAASSYTIVSGMAGRQAKTH